MTISCIFSNFVHHLVASVTNYYHSDQILFVCFSRANTTYYGGYHNKHRVINWLWEIVEKDFNDSEKSAFLKVSYCRCNGSVDKLLYQSQVDEFI